jgi:hypothetical protein
MKTMRSAPIVDSQAKCRVFRERDRGGRMSTELHGVVLEVK